MTHYKAQPWGLLPTPFFRIFPDYNFSKSLKSISKVWSLQKAEHKAGFDLAEHCFLLKLFSHGFAKAQTIVIKAPTITSKASHMAATLMISLICSHPDSLNSHLLILKYKTQ